VFRQRHGRDGVPAVRKDWREQAGFWIHHRDTEDTEGVWCSSKGMGGTASSRSARIGGHRQVFGFTTETQRTQGVVFRERHGRDGVPAVRKDWRARGTVPLPGIIVESGTEDCAPPRDDRGRRGLRPSRIVRLGGTVSSRSVKIGGHRGLCPSRG
jgi:hypothetical protein